MKKQNEKTYPYQGIIGTTWLKVIISIIILTIYMIIPLVSSTVRYSSMNGASDITIYTMMGIMISMFMGIIVIPIMEIIIWALIIEPIRKMKNKKIQPILTIVSALAGVIPCLIYSIKMGYSLFSHVLAIVGGSVIGIIGACLIQISIYGIIYMFQIKKLDRFNPDNWRI